MDRRFAAALAALLMCATISPGQPASSRTELLVSVLDSVVRTSPEDRRASSLRALRELQDEDLRPLFAHFAAQRDPLLRANGIFALAEYEEPPAVNTQMLAKIQSPAEQAGLIGDAMGRGYLSTAEIEEVLRWSSHTPAVEALLLASLGEGIEDRRSRLVELNASESPRASLVADLLLIHLDRERERIDRIVSGLAENETDLRLARLSFILDVIRRNELSGCGPLLVALDAEFGDDERINHDVIGTLMRLDPTLAKDLWRRSFASASSLAPRLRLAYHALSESDRLGTDFFDGLTEGAEQPMLSTIIGVARDNAKGDVSDDALLKLVALRQRPATLWAVEYTDGLADERAIPILGEVVEDVLSRDDRRSAVSPYFVEAASRLADRSPAALTGPIERANAARDLPATEALLAAVLREGSELPWRAGEAPEWHDNRAGALASIAEARLAPQTLKAADNLERLERVALGYGSLPHLFRVQASWLALESQGEGRRAIAQIISETPTETNDESTTRGRQP